MTLKPRRSSFDAVARHTLVVLLLTLCGVAFAAPLRVVPKLDPKLVAQNSVALRFPTQIKIDPITRIPFAVLGDGRQYRLLTPGQVQEGQALSAQIANLPNQIQLRRAGPWVLKSGPPPATFDLMSFQTGIRDQAQRGTCTYHSTTAAMEAAYKRGGFGDLDLSEQFMTWLRDVTLLANAENPSSQSQTDATKRECQVGSLSGGGSSHNIMLMTKYGICREADDPYIGTDAYDNYSDPTYYPGAGLASYVWDNQSFPQAPINNWNFAPAQFPEAARNDLRYGVDEFVSLTSAEVRNSSTLESIISSGHEVIVDLDLYWGPVSPARPAWVYAPGQTERGGHSMLFIGYDRTRHFFIVKNSWAPVHYNAASLAADWRDITRFEGYTLVDYSYLQTASGGSYITRVPPPTGGKYNQERVLGNWDIHFYRKSTRAEVGRGTIAWRHIPGTWWGLPNPDRRIGDYAQGARQYRVNGALRPGITNNITLYIDFDHPAQRYDELRGDMLQGTLRAFGVGQVSISGEDMLDAGGTHNGSLFGVPRSDLTFYATHR